MSEMEDEYGEEDIYGDELEEEGEDEDIEIEENDVGTEQKGDDLDEDATIARAALESSGQAVE